MLLESRRYDYVGRTFEGMRKLECFLRDYLGREDSSGMPTAFIAQIISEMVHGLNRDYLRREHSSGLSAAFIAQILSELLEGLLLDYLRREHSSGMSSTFIAQIISEMVTHHLKGMSWLSRVVVLLEGHCDYLHVF